MGVFLTSFPDYCRRTTFFSREVEGCKIKPWKGRSGNAEWVHMFLPSQHLFALQNLALSPGVFPSLPRELSLNPGPAWSWPSLPASLSQYKIWIVVEILF